MRRNTTAAVQLSTRAAAAAGISVIVARLLDLPFPLYAMIAAVIVTDLSPVRTRQLAVPRIVGTVLGASVGAGLTSLADPNVWLLMLGILGVMFAAQMLRLHDAAKLAGYVCGIVLLEHRDAAWTYAVYRLIETLVGIGVAVLVSLVPKLMREATAEERGS